MLWTDLARLFLGSALLAFASWTDWRWRRAPNVLWLVMLAGGVLLLAADALLHFDDVRAAWPYLVAAPVLAGLYYLMYQFHLIAGGADAKALMAIAILAPFPIRFTTNVPLLGGASPFPWSVVAFVDALLAFLAVPLAYFVANAARGRFGATMFLGLKKRVEDVDRGHYWLMERVDESGRVRLHYLASKGAYDLDEQKRLLKEQGIDRVWVTPKVPFMIPLLMGFVLAFFLGDVLFAAMEALLG